MVLCHCSDKLYSIMNSDSSVKSDSLNVTGQNNMLHAELPITAL